MLTNLILLSLLTLLAPQIIKWLGRSGFVVLALGTFYVLVQTVLLLPEVLAGEIVAEEVQWIPDLNIALAFRMDGLSWLMAIIVLGVGTLVLLYSSKYFQSSEPKLDHFAAYLFGFAATMYGLVVADDIMMMFIFWEITTVLSYLLIGHHSEKKESRGAAIEAMLITTLGGLAMLVGLVMLIIDTGSSRFSELVLTNPDSTFTIVAMVLILAGALSKAAQIPFHFWLPAAMAAPTTVSAYLHAAAMVKAGVYLIARLAPEFQEIPYWREIVVTVGVLTMLIGGWRAVRQYDLKLLLAYGTVSQLGLITAVIGYGSSETLKAGMALLIGHALFKSGLFLVVGIIDHQAGTRDLRKLSGIGKLSPVLFVTAVFLVGSMIGFPFFIGFVAKEAALEALILHINNGEMIAVFALVCIVIGSILTAAYAFRFLHGGFATKTEIPVRQWQKPSWTFMAVPVFLAVVSMAVAFMSKGLDDLLSAFTDANAAGPGIEALDPGFKLSLWHGLGPVFYLSMSAILFGALLFVIRRPFANMQARLPAWIDLSRAYWASIRAINHASARLVTLIQHPGLPGYLSTILVVFIIFGGYSIWNHRVPENPLVFWDYPSQPVIGLIIIVAAFGAAMSKKRMTGVLLAGITGYGMVVLFAFAGAPDLALTQILVETVTLIVFVLVLRRLPSKAALPHDKSRKVWRIIISTLFAVTMMAVAYLGMSSRIHEPISGAHPGMAVEQGHGLNVVNVMLVDIRAWDTLGEISVLVVVATGLASLLFVTTRTVRQDRLQGAEELRRNRKARKSKIMEPVTGSISVISTIEATKLAAQKDVEARQSWLLAGRTIRAKNRSLMLEIVVRLTFHPIMILSIFLLFVGHNAPGGGFAGGLVAGLALVSRYLAAGRYELTEAMPFEPGRVLGFGIFLAAGSAVSGLFFAKDVMTATWFSWDLPVIGELSFGTPLFFDIGVYLVVVGLVLDVLSSLGAEVDRQEEDSDAATLNVAPMPETPGQVVP